MAFDLNGWGKVSASSNTKAPTMFSYKSTVDAVAAIKASAYFNLQKSSLNIGDAIYIYGQDAKAQLVKVAAVTPNVTVTQIAGEA